MPDPWAQRADLQAIGLKLQDDPQASPGLKAAARHTVSHSYRATGSPLLYAFVHAISTGDYDLDYALFHLLSLLCACAAVLLLCSDFGWPPWASLLAVAAVVGASPPLQSDAWVGNVNQIQLLGLSLAFVVRKRAPACGAVLGLLVLFKPNIAVVALLLWAVSPDRLRFLAGAAGGGIAGLLASMLVFAPRAWLSWMRAAADIASDARVPSDWGNLSLAHLIGLPGWAANASLIALALVSLVFALRSKSAIAALGAGMAVPLLCSTVAWQHYFLLLTPALLFFIRKPAGIAAVALLWVVPLVAPSVACVAVFSAAGAIIVLALSWGWCGAMTRENAASPA